jgi:hypothetical protein
VLAELLRNPLVPWIATYLTHSTILCGAAWGFDLWSRGNSARERTLGPARERLWKLALFLPVASTIVQCGGELSLWRLPAEVHTTSPVADLPAAGLAPWRELAGGPTQPSAAPTLPLRIAWPLVAAALWLVGVLWGALVWLREWHALGRAVRGLVPCADAELTAEFDALRAGDPALASTRLYVGRAVLVPLTLGWWRMRVVVPERAAFGLDADERRAMLAHELAHARRRDPLWISAARAVEGLFCFQPLNRLARIRLQDEAEFLADRWAIERGVGALSLASCLTEVAGWIVSNRRALPVPSMAARGARLTRRVERLLEERRAPLPLRTAPWSVAFLALALGSAAAAVPGRAAQTSRTVDAPRSTSGDPGSLFERATPVSAIRAPASEPADLAAQFDQLAEELEQLARDADERVLDERWHQRFAELRMRLATLQTSYGFLMELVRTLPPTSTPPATDTDL